MKGSTSEQTVEVTDALLRENAEMLQNRAASPLDEVKVESTGRNILWEVDVRRAPSMLQLVAKNLLSNAVKYPRLRDPAIIKGRSICDEHEVVFFVRDNGVGCNIQYVDKRLGIFQRLHNARKSSKAQVLDSPA
jgi:chemotaxis family two-component system sensor kinase Cph1